MVIDFHTHFFNDDIADRTLQKLTQTGGIKPYTKGNLSDTLRIMDDAGVEVSVLLPIATKPSQVQVINDWAAGLASDRIIPFGTVHPDLCDYKTELKRIRDLGMKGIKLHPDYQQFFIDEKRMYPLYEAALDAGLYIYFHTGYDIGLGLPVHADCRGCGRIVDDLGGDKFIFAHLGGYVKGEFETHIMGKNVYIDTAYSLLFLENKQCESIILGHGADKVVFGADVPWGHPKTHIEKILSLKLTNDDKEKILCGNAKRILGIE